MAYYVTYGLPVTITRGANNIGPYQYPEKVVPLFVTNAIDDQPLPVYGDGKQRRDYQYVLDHCEGIDLVLHRGMLGEIYNVGTGAEMDNLDMVEILLDELGKPASLIQHVEDRPGPRPALLPERRQAQGAGLAAATTRTKRRSARPCAGTWPTSGGGARSSRANSRNITGGCTASARSSTPLPERSRAAPQSGERDVFGRA